jgi:hypothetical protein
MSENKSLEPSIEALPLLPIIMSLPSSFLENEEVAHKLMMTVIAEYGTNAIDAATPETLGMGVMLLLIFHYDYSFIAEKVANHSTLKFMLELYREGKLQQTIDSILKSLNTIH